MSEKEERIIEAMAEARARSSGWTVENAKYGIGQFWRSQYAEAKAQRAAYLAMIEAEKAEQ